MDEKKPVTSVGDEKKPVTSVGDKKEPDTSVGDKKEPDKKATSSKIDYSQKGEQWETTTGIPGAPIPATDMSAEVKDPPVDTPFPIFDPGYADIEKVIPAGSSDFVSSKMRAALTNPYANSNTEKPNATTINHITVQGNLLVHDEKELTKMVVAVNKQKPSNRSGH